ncbi:DUF58 domain-containing protein [Zestomonas carbonaria]|uniref:DUF58 domain-containing protein n=1 Tax=Zestomonas carbonaria TaxID=2762745 RepID=A0A7U7EQP0_9GAMM|nr:DUF58 domain-containing protein [Pseudomonas carbonaria]CAD5109388.1 hypothetical protein PSEWESI4_03685 [Pseudomonas carbonaria]
MDHHDTTGLVQVSLDRLIALERPARGLDFLSRQPRSSILAGQHASRLRGRGLNFDELRHYLPGDDLRRLDWRASLRHGRPFVRTFSEERDRPALVLVDQRMNMYFGSRRSFKSAIAAELGALAAWIAFQAGDRVGGIVFGDQATSRLRPLRSRRQVEALCAAIASHNRTLCATQPEIDNGARLDDMLQDCLAMAGHDHLICIVSDFAGASPRTLQLLRRLSAHNDVIAMLVYDPLALELPTRGRLVVTQGELQVALEVGHRQVRQPLGEFLLGRLNEVAGLLRRSRVPLLMFSTGQGALEQLRQELGRLPGASR